MLSLNEGALILYDPRYDPSNDAFLQPHFATVLDPIFDLSLNDPNHIPLLRTACNLLHNQALFVISRQRRQSSGRDSEEKSFESAGLLEENDYIRLENIRLLFGNRPPSTANISSQHHWLRNLSFQVDAMNVYEKLIRDSAESAFGPNKGLAAKLLSFLHHGLIFPVASLNPDVHDYIVKALFSSNDFVVFQRVMEEVLAFDHERNRSLLERTKWLNRIDSLISLHDFANSAYSTSPEQNDFSVQLIDVSFEHDLYVLNNPTRKEIRRMMANPMYLMGELEAPKRFNSVINILQNKTDHYLRQNFRVPEAQAAIEVAKETVSRNAEEFQQRRARLTGQVYPTLQFYVGFLYEYENLRASLTHLGSFLPTFDATSVESRKQFIQVVVMISEALNGLFLPLRSRSLQGQFSIIELGIDPTQDVIPLRDLLTFLRNKVFEHPLPWQRKKLEHLLDITRATTTEIFNRLREDIRVLEDRIVHRVNFIGSVLRGEGDWRGTLVSLFERYRDNAPLPKEPGRDEYRAAKSLKELEEQRHWQSHPLPTFQALRRYFFYPSFHLPTVIETDLSVQQRTKETVFKSGEMLSKAPLAHTWDDLYECLNDLKAFVGSSLCRGVLFEKINNNFGNCLEAKRLINNFYQILRGLLENPSTSNYRDKINPRFKKVFEHFYLGLRNLRNFQTHDLWRLEDLNRLANNMLRTVTFFEQAFSKRALPPELSITEPMCELLDGVKSNKFTPELIKVYINLHDLYVNYVDHNGLTLLHYAVQNDNQSVARVLLELGANLHLMNQEGDTLLHEAVSEEQYNLAQLLLDFGALMDTKDNQGHTVLDIAIERLKERKITPKRRDFIALLRRYDSTQRGDEADALQSAVRERNVKNVYELLLQGHAPFLYDREGQLALVQAMDEWVPTNLSLEMADFLLRSGAEVNQREFNGGKSALYYAAQDKDPRRVALLLSHRAQPDLPGMESPLSQAVHASAETLNLLLSAGAQPSSVDCIGQTSLLALMNSHARSSHSKAEVLLAAGADPNECNEFGTVLHNVLEKNGSTEAALALLRAGAAPFVKGWGGLYADNTPIEVAMPHFKALLDTWIATEGQIVSATLQNPLPYLAWSDLWKKKLVALYSGGAPHATDQSQILIAFDNQNISYFSVVKGNETLNIIENTAENIADLILKNIAQEEIRTFIRNDVIRDSHDLIDSPLPDLTKAQMEQIRLMAVWVARTKKAIKVYRTACAKDYGLDPDLTDEQRVNHPTLLPQLKAAFQKLLEDKREFTYQMSEPLMQVGNEALLRNYLVNSVESGRWLEAGKSGFSGVLQAYARLSGINLVNWELTIEPGERDLYATTSAHGAAQVLHLMRVRDYKYGCFHVLKSVEGAALLNRADRSHNLVGLPGSITPTIKGRAPLPLLIPKEETESKRIQEILPSQPLPLSASSLQTAGYSQGLSGQTIAIPRLGTGTSASGRQVTDICLLFEAIKNLDFKDVEKIIQKLKVTSIRSIVDPSSNLPVLESLPLYINGIDLIEQMKTCILQSVTNQRQHPPVPWTPLADARAQAEHKQASVQPALPRLKSRSKSPESG